MGNVQNGPLLTGNPGQSCRTFLTCSDDEKPVQILAFTALDDPGPTPRSIAAAGAVRWPPKGWKVNRNPKGWRYQKPKEEIRASLQEQLDHMRRSAEAFDSGTLAEGQRLATSVYVICSDGGRNSRSLLSQLGVRDGMKFPDSSPPHLMILKYYSRQALHWCA